MACGGGTNIPARLTSVYSCHSVDVGSACSHSSSSDFLFIEDLLTLQGQFRIAPGPETGLFEYRRVSEPPSRNIKVETIHILSVECFGHIFISQLDVRRGKKFPEPHLSESAKSRDSPPTPPPVAAQAVAAVMAVAHYPFAIWA